MDNKLNEIRQRISALRTDMSDLENQIRLQVRHDIDCTDASLRLIENRKELVALIRERNALGGSENCPTIAERLAASHRPVAVRKRDDVSGV
jgi:hypothetical protein